MNFSGGIMRNAKGLPSRKFLRTAVLTDAGGFSSGRYAAPALYLPEYLQSRALADRDKTLKTYRCLDLAQLMRLEKKYDPDRMFVFEQSIPST